MALSQNCSSTFRILQVLTLTASLAALLSSASSKRHASIHGSTPIQLPASIKYFVHALDSGSVISVPPNNAITTGTFGQVSIFSYTIHEGADLSSKQLGTIRGVETYNSVDPIDITILILNTVTYADGVHNGTLSIHGQGNIIYDNYELTVVGGTGSFRGVTGYAAITNLRTPGEDHVFEHDVHFVSAPSTACPAISV